MDAPAPRRINSPSKAAPQVGATPYHRRNATSTPDRTSQPQQPDRINERPAPASSQSVFRLEEHVIQTPPQHSLYSAAQEDRSLQRGPELHRTPPSQTFSASHSVDSATEKGSNAKLPHGLTVYELKEMTKARLEAEAGQRGEMPPPVESHGPVPSTVRVSAEYQESMGGARNAPLPVPLLSYGRLSSRSPYPVDSTTEAWESASVSTCASDYPGSESVYSTGLNGNASFNGDEVILFSRSASYPSNPGQMNDWSHENRPPSYIAAPSAYYDGYTPNRRRAATMSPRPGLSYVHEDRPVVAGQMPCIPSDFSSPSLQQRQRQLPSRSRSAFVPEVLNYGHSQQQQQQGGYPVAGVIGESSANHSMDMIRPRSFSAASLPAISNSAEEFYLDNRGTPARFNSQFGIVREDAATDSVAGLSDVFRGSPICFHDSAALIGFGSTNSSIGLGSSVDSFGGGDNNNNTMRMRAATSSDFVVGGLNDNFSLNSAMEDRRLRAATWGESSALDIFCGHDLSDDLASILKLSGAEQRDP